MGLKLRGEKYINWIEGHVLLQDVCMTARAEKHNTIARCLCPAERLSGSPDWTTGQVRRPDRGSRRLPRWEYASGQAGFQQRGCVGWQTGAWAKWCWIRLGRDGGSGRTAISRMRSSVSAAARGDGSHDVRVYLSYLGRRENNKRKSWRRSRVSCERASSRVRIPSAVEHDQSTKNAKCTPHNELDKLLDWDNPLYSV
jgi:hypothetical protein